MFKIFVLAKTVLLNCVHSAISYELSPQLVIVDIFLNLNSDSLTVFSVDQFESSILFEID